MLSDNISKAQFIYYSFRSILLSYTFVSLISIPIYSKNLIRIIPINIHIKNTNDIIHANIIIVTIREFLNNAVKINIDIITPVINIYPNNLNMPNNTFFHLSSFSFIFAHYLYSIFDFYTNFTNIITVCKQFFDIQFCSISKSIL